MNAILTLAESGSPFDVAAVLTVVNTLLLIHVFWGQSRIAKNQQRMAEAIEALKNGGGAKPKGN